MPPKILYFDMGNVLISFSHQRAAEQIAAISGITPARAWEIVFDDGLQWEYERGTINCGQFYHLFCLESGCSPDRATFDHAGSAIFEPLPRMLPILAALRRDGRSLGVLSNTSPSHWRYVTGRFRFLTDLFGLHALSFEIGEMKPAPEIYAAAEEMAGAAGPEIFFTDDREENVAAALSRGWDAVLFTSPRELACALSTRGIAVNY
jgi:glucose-1-phosphatase